MAVGATTGLIVQRSNNLTISAALMRLFRHAVRGVQHHRRYAKHSGTAMLERGWKVFFQLFRRGAAKNAFARPSHHRRCRAARFIWRRGNCGGQRWFLWGCLTAVAVTFPLVFSWTFFDTVPGDLGRYRGTSSLPRSRLITPIPAS